MDEKIDALEREVRDLCDTRTAAMGLDEFDGLNVACEAIELVLCGYRMRLAEISDE